MATRGAMIGREQERQRLAQALEAARRGTGSLMLVAGDAGVGKTRLAEELAAGAAAVVLCGRAPHGAAAPYGPIVAALRGYLRSQPDGLAECGPLRPHLALLLPELGETAATSDHATLYEAVRCAFAVIAAQRPPLLVVLDDLQWSDDATLELLPVLAESLAPVPVLVVAAYRSDGLARDHVIRRVRQDLRRFGRLDEVMLTPVGPAETGALLTELLGAHPAPSLVRAIHDRTQGFPYFVEEMARGLRVTGSLTEGRGGLELAESGAVPVPDTIRDAVLLTASELSPEARATAEAAAVAGEDFDLDVLAGVASVAGLAELMERDLIRDAAPGRGAFRHALAREALYADVPWLQRRALHRRVAEALEAGRARGMEVATHWLGAREEDRAREWLLRAAEESRAVHAHGD